MEDNFNAILDIDEHPFFVGLIEPRMNYDLPLSLPFRMGVHPMYAIPRLVMNQEVRDALSNAYSIGSMISTPLGESQLASDRMNEVLEKIVSIFSGDIKGKKFLEIGCGTGEFLNQLKLRGASVVGMEIGPQANSVEEKFGIRVIKEPLKEGVMDEKFDCIYSYGCLEHIENLEEFFTASRLYLNDGGVFFHSVPNALYSFERVHVDHLLHEHINYFTPDNGRALFNAQGFVCSDCSLTSNGNELMLWGQYNSASSIRWPEERVQDEITMLENYSTKLRNKETKILEAIKRIVNRGESLGFYAGGYEYGILLDKNDIRYFDGDSYKHGKQWLLGLPLIESPSALSDTPVDKLIICKPHYFSKIKELLLQIGVNENCIVNIDELMSSITS